MLEKAIYNHDIAATDAALDAGAKLNDKIWGMFPLLLVCMVNDKIADRAPFLAYLMSLPQARAMVNTCLFPDRSSTLLHAVASRFREESDADVACVRILLKAGADVTIRAIGNAGHGATALYLARKHGNTKCARLLERAELGEWHPQKHARYSVYVRNAMHTLVCLAKART